MVSHVIVPLDGSELAERALPLAAYVAELSRSGLKLVQAPVVPGSLEVATAIGILMEAGHEYLDEQEANLRRRYTVSTSKRTAVGSPAELILDEATKPDAVAVVMTTHGRTGLRRAVMGSVAEQVVRGSPIPVYLLPVAARWLPDRPRIRHILVPLDGSPLAYSVLGPLPQIARRAGARVTLVRVFGEEEELTRPPHEPVLTIVDHQVSRLESKAHSYFAPIKAHLRAAGLMVEAEWLVGMPADQILEAADRLHTDLIALATHGRSGLDRLRYGSVAESVLRHSTVPVMTFGPQALKRLASGVEPLAAAKRLPELVFTRKLSSYSHRV